MEAPLQGVVVNPSGLAGEVTAAIDVFTPIFLVAAGLCVAAYVLDHGFEFINSREFKYYAPSWWRDWEVRRFRHRMGWDSEPQESYPLRTGDPNNALDVALGLVPGQGRIPDELRPRGRGGLVSMDEALGLRPRRRR